MARYVLVLLITVIACPLTHTQDERQQGAATPEELVQAYVKAIQNGDESAIEALVPDVARLHQKVKIFAQRMDEKLKLQEEWKKELDKRFVDTQDGFIRPPVDLEKPEKINRVVEIHPDYTAVIVEKKVVDGNNMLLTVETTGTKQADKRRVSWQAKRINNRWVLSVPEMKQAVELYEKAMEMRAGSDESIAAMRQALADLKLGKFTKRESAEAAWKKASEMTARLKLAGDKEFTLPGPGRKLPSPDGQSDATTTIEFRLADKLDAPGLVAMKLPGSTETIYVAREASLTHRNIQKVTVQQGNLPTLTIAFTESSQATLKQILNKPEFRMIAVIIDGKLVAAPLIDNQLTERLVIKGVASSYFRPFMGK